MANVSSTRGPLPGPNGKIELYSGQYYASCAIGGLLACVGFSTFHWRPEQQGNTHLPFFLIYRA